MADEWTDIFRNLSAFTYGKAFLKIGDGRNGYYVIYDHYFGPGNSVNDQALAAEAAICNLSSNGDGRHWDSEKHVTDCYERTPFDFGWIGRSCICRC